MSSFGDLLGGFATVLSPEIGNLRAALDWAVAQGEADMALRLAAGMFDPHRTTGDNAREQRQWTQRALALSGGSPANRVKALTSAACCTTGPREVLTRIASGFIWRNCSSPIMPRVSAFNSGWQETTSASRSRSASSGTIVTPSPATSSGDTYGS